jgi:site-specific recombinase XerD
MCLSADALAPIMIQKAYTCTWKRVRSDGAVYASAHTLRHTFAHNYLSQYPGDIVGLAALLGHSSLDTTRLYGEPTVSQLARRVEQLHSNAYS